MYIYSSKRGRRRRRIMDDFNCKNVLLTGKYKLFYFLSDKSQPSPPRGVGWATSKSYCSDYYNLLMLTANEGTGHLEK